MTTVVPPTRPAASSLRSACTSRSQTHRRRRDQRFRIAFHLLDQGFDEARRRKQCVALEIDHKVRLMELSKRFGTTLGAVAAFGRGHDHADPRWGAGLRNPLIVGGDEHARNAAHSARCLDASLDQGLGKPARAFQRDERFSRITRRCVPRRDDDDAVHRCGGQSWMWSTPTGFFPSVSSTTKSAVILMLFEQCQRIVDQRVRPRPSWGPRVMNSAAL